MALNNHTDIQSVFDEYRSAMQRIDVDIKFWSRFLELSINTYQEKNSRDSEIFSGVFHVYDLDSASAHGFLKTSQDSFSIAVSDLDREKEIFFTWIINSSLLSAYNAMEILLLRAIWLRFFPTLTDPTTNKRAANKLQTEIDTHLHSRSIAVVTKNNKYIYDFLEDKCPDLAEFGLQLVRIDQKTTWSSFYKLISILRNIMAHTRAEISDDLHNEIKSIANDTFELYFSAAKDSKGKKRLVPVQANYENFLNMINDLSINIIKFINEKNDFQFLGLG